MICPSCGGEYADWAQKCPYCGSINEKADEEIYLAHLEEVRKRLDVVDEESEEIYRREVGSSVKRMLKLVALLSAAVVVLLAAFVFWRKSTEKRREKETIEEMAWQKEAYPKLDALYAEGKYDEILEAYYRILGEDHSIYDWEHYYFVVEFYQNHLWLEQAMKKDFSELEAFELGEAFYSGLWLKYRATDAYLKQLETSYAANRCYGLTSEEVEMIPAYREEAERFFREYLGWTEEEARALYEEELDDYDYISLSGCYEKAEKYLEEMR